MNTLQALFDAIDDAAARERSTYHLTLSGLIAALEAVPAQCVVQYADGRSPGEPMSYRGYYSDLCFADAPDTVVAKDFLKTAGNALGKTFTGYKGGDFTMTRSTPLWRSEYGHSSGHATISTTLRSAGVLELVTKEID